MYLQVQNERILVLTKYIKTNILNNFLRKNIKMIANTP